MSDTYRKESCKDWRSAAPANPTLEQINTGTLQRIADACELMAKDREKMERDYAYMRNGRDMYRERSERYERSNSALRGQITKLKRAAEIAKGVAK